MVCSKCGHELDMDSKFCDNCGQAFKKQRKLSKGGKFSVSVIVFVFAFLLVVIFGEYNFQNINSHVSNFDISDSQSLYNIKLLPEILSGNTLTVKFSDNNYDSIKPKITGGISRHLNISEDCVLAYNQNDKSVSIEQTNSYSVVYDVYSKNNDNWDYWVDKVKIDDFEDGKLYSFKYSIQYDSLGIFNICHNILNFYNNKKATNPDYNTDFYITNTSYFIYENGQFIDPLITDNKTKYINAMWIDDTLYPARLKNNGTIVAYGEPIVLR